LRSIAPKNKGAHDKIFYCWLLLRLYSCCLNSIPFVEIIVSCWNYILFVEIIFSRIHWRNIYKRGLRPWVNVHFSEYSTLKHILQVWNALTHLIVRVWSTGIILFIPVEQRFGAPSGDKSEQENSSHIQSTWGQPARTYYIIVSFMIMFSWLLQYFEFAFHQIFSLKFCVYEKN